MITNGKLIHTKDNRLVIDLDNPINPDVLAKLSGGVQPSVEVDIEDNRTITPEQRKKAFAMIGDIASWQGDLPQAVEEMFKYFAMSTFSEIPEHFSLSNCSVTTARLYIQLLLEFCFRWDVPFATKTWDAISSDFGTQMQCLKHRQCVICRKRAQYAHVETVGMGRNRHKIDHSQYHFMALCPIHHAEQHNIGIMTFIQRYHIKPIKLNYDQLVKLGIMRKGTAYYFKEQLEA
ncbi:putative HNHc nuclease [Loigolactobacillus binensis]|uniref:HNHc nuclease n=1 Tax=Loigolactobacillus binensis TaxID=2559922 RepID=A0ABW3ECA5_9LACO|nr:putative HNHc nuclease [Loigolactobacillus binensis]